MADVFKTIFEMEGQGSTVLKELDDIKAKYTGINTAMRDQESELEKLIAEERKLVQARKESTNPNQAVAYSNKISDARNRITELQKELTKVTAEQTNVSKGADTMQTKITKAMDTTKINALNTSLDKLETNLKETGTDATKAGADLTKAYVNPIRQIETLKTKLFELQNAQVVASTAEEFDNLTKEIKLTEAEVKKLESDFTDKPEQKVLSLRAQLKSLKADLANATDPQDIERLAKEAGELTDKIQDANDAANLFASDSPFEQVGNGISSVSQKLLSLDFAGAAQQSKLLLKASQSITFKESLTGIKQIGTTLLNVGKALLTNPLFLIGGAIIAIIANFDKLKKAGGLVGTIFKELGNIITGLEDSFFALTDAIGLTSVALERLNEAKINKLSGQLEDDIKTLDRYSKAVKATGKDVEEIELRKQKAIIESSEKQLELLRQITKNGKDATDEQIKQDKDLVNAILDAENEKFVIENESNQKKIKEAKRYADDRLKVFDDLEKKLREVQQKGEEFNIAFRVDNGSQEQLQRAFDLRKKLEDQELKDLREKTLKELKTTADKNAAIIKLNDIARQTELNRTQEFEKQKLDLSLENNKKVIEASRDRANKETEIDQANQLTDAFFIADEKLKIQKKYYSDSIALLEADIVKRKALGLSTFDAEKALYELRLEAATENAKGQDELNKIELADREKTLDADLAHFQSVLTRKNALTSSHIQLDLDAEKTRLRAMIASGEVEVEAITAQQDKILQLEKDVKRQRINEAVDASNQIVQAALSATNQILAAKTKEVDGLISLQQKRVDEIHNIAQNGNAEMLEEEKKRLDDLNKEKEKFVRAQQALAVIELIANTAVMISKAAAEGGVLAGVTIAAALIALVGGLVAARQTAAQAAYYEGGYTGDGNPRDVSNTMNGKATTRPYVWHKKEFVMNHDITHKDDNLNIFKDIHAGKINLTELRDKSLMFDSMRQLEFNKKAEIFFTHSNSNADYSRLETKLNDVVQAVQSQERALLNLDANGFSLYLSNVEKRRSDIANFAK